MSNQIQGIALRIRDLREISGISVGTLAKELGVERETYVGYESGEIDIPIGFLYELANKYKVELTAILTGSEPKLRSYSLTRKGDGVIVDRKKQYHYLSLAYNFVGKKGEPFMVTIDPKGENDDVSLSSHPGQEFNYMVEGRLQIFIDGHEAILETGDSLYFDSSKLHGMKALDDKPAKLLAIIIH